MSKNIPLYQLSALTESRGHSSGVFFLGQQSEPPKIPIHKPYRGNYYKIGICLGGRAELTANLETYAIGPDCLIIMSPQTIKQWTYMSDDYNSLDIFFTKDFIAGNNSLNLDKFPFLERSARHAFQISATQSENISTSLGFIQEKYNIHHVYREEVLKNLITGLLYEIASIYEQQVVAHSMQTRSQLLASEFKKLVYVHFSTERSLKFYADKLFITPKHLTETVKEVTGKTASEWITDSVILEAKVLLQTPPLSIAQLSDMLHFTDQSTFGKFFKKNTGLSPAAYKQAL